MQLSKVTLAYRQVITISHEGELERRILSASYQEFLLKSQAYNPDSVFNTFKEMVANDGRANSLHYKCGFAIGNHIELMRNQMPGLTTSLGDTVVFDNYEFKLIDSHIRNYAAHAIAIIYYTNELALLSEIGGYLLLSNDLSSVLEQPRETFLIKMQDNLSIVSYRVM